MPSAGQRGGGCNGSTEASIDSGTVTQVALPINCRLRIIMRMRLNLLLLSVLLKLASSLSPSKPRWSKTTAPMATPSLGRNRLKQTCSRHRLAVHGEDSTDARHEEDEGKSTTAAQMAANDGDPPSVVAQATDPPPSNNEMRTSKEATFSDVMAAMGTSPRRIALSAISATGIALAGNLFGVTSKLLTVFPEDQVAPLDTYFPRGDFKRYMAPDYTFVFPKQWVGDTALELAKAQRRTTSLDYSMARTSPQQQGKSGGRILPDAAFGPPGRLDARGVSQGDINVSVIRTAATPSFSLRETMKSPTEGATFLLQNSIAPPQSGRQATLLDASEDEGTRIYRFEYRVDRAGEEDEKSKKGPFPLRAISVLAESKQSSLLTLTVVAPEKEWNDSDMEAKLRKIASSFRLR